MELKRFDIVFPILGVALMLSLFGCGSTEGKATPISATSQLPLLTVEPTLIRTPIKTESNGTVFVSKWGTRGSGDGEFSSPNGVAVASDGSVYVSEGSNHRIQKFSMGP